MDDKFERFSFLDMIREADDDENTGEDNNASPDTNAEANDTNANDNTDNVDDTGDNEDNDADNGEFDVDASIPEDADAGNDDTEGEDDTGDDMDTTSTSSDTTDEEPKEANTAIFDNLSAEEQAIKIKELKNNYNNLYGRVDDILNRIANMDLDEDSLDIMSRITLALYDLKESISTYFLNMFDIKSYLENDIRFNEFLAILKGITVVLDDVSSKKQKILGQNDTKVNKKS